jgi:hypothetical protein
VRYHIHSARRCSNYLLELSLSERELSALIEAMTIYYMLLSDDGTEKETKSITSRSGRMTSAGGSFVRV